MAPPVIGSPTSSPSGGGGSCDFWKSHSGKWPSFLSGFGTLLKLFGGRAGSVFGNRMTLMEALVNPNQDGYSALARQGAASLLNAYTVAGFVYTPEQVRVQFNNALESPDLASKQAATFEQANLSV